MLKPRPGRPADPAKDADILAAGRVLLFDHGPQAVTMEAVARAAGVSKPTLYRRYANRDELLAALAANEAERLAGRFSIAPDTVDDLSAALTGFGTDLKRFLISAEHIRFLHALGASTEMPQSVRQSIYRHGPRNARDRLAEWLQQAQAQGLLHCPDPRASAEQFMGMVMGLDLVRTLYHVDPRAEGPAPEARVGRIVADFLRLHRPD